MQGLQEEYEWSLSSSKSCKFIGNFLLNHRHTNMVFYIGGKSDSTQLTCRYYGSDAY